MGSGESEQHHGPVCFGSAQLMVEVHSSPTEREDESPTKLVFHISHVSTADCFLVSGMPQKSRQDRPVLLAGGSPECREADVVFRSQTSQFEM